MCWRSGGRVRGAVRGSVGAGGRCSCHALWEDRVSAGLADDEVSPLHDHDAGKEGRLACELQHLALFIGLGEGGQRGAVSVRRDSNMPQRPLPSPASPDPKAEIGPLFRFLQPFTCISVLALSML